MFQGSTVPLTHQKIFTPWHRCLPKKILLNFVAAKASRHISCPFCPFTCTPLYHFLYCWIYYLQLNLRIYGSVFLITNFMILAFWKVVLAFGFLMWDCCWSVLSCRTIGPGLFCTPPVTNCTFHFIAKTQVSPSLWSFLALSALWFLADIGLPWLCKCPLSTYMLINLACTLAHVSQT